VGEVLERRIGKRESSLIFCLCGWYLLIFLRVVPSSSFSLLFSLQGGESKEGVMTIRQEGNLCSSCFEVSTIRIIVLL